MAEEILGQRATSKPPRKRPKKLPRGKGYSLLELTCQHLLSPEEHARMSQREKHAVMRFRDMSRSGAELVARVARQRQRLAETLAVPLEEIQMEPGLSPAARAADHARMQRRIAEILADYSAPEDMVAGLELIEGLHELLNRPAIYQSARCRELAACLLDMTASAWPHLDPDSVRMYFAGAFDKDRGRNTARARWRNREPAPEDVPRFALLDQHADEKREQLKRRLVRGGFCAGYEEAELIYRRWRALLKANGKKE